MQGRFTQLLPLFLVLGLSVGAQDRRVVAYVSHDEEHSREILELFEKETGIKAALTFDTEDTKTVGLTKRLISEASRPVCDVFWNNEAGQTERLRERGLLEPYVSPNAAGIPAAFKDPAGHWTGFGARARVLVWNREQILEDELPKTMEDLAAPRFKDKLLIAKPLTGTTLTHVAALYSVWGEERTNAWLDRLMANGVSWEMGNGPVAQKVADGVRPMGLTDTDDVNVRLLDGHPVGTAYLDQGEGGLGTFVIPNTVMIMKGAPNPAEARLLVDFLLSPRVEGLLAKGRAAQMPLHPDVAAPEHVLPVSRLKTMDVDFGAVGAAIEKRALDLNDRFARIQGGELVDGDKGSMALLWAVVALVLAGLFVYLALRPGREGAARS